jgi:hypothetical protein
MVRDIQFTWEPVSYLLSCGLHDLGHQHWLEGVPDKDTFPYDPDWEGFEELEKANIFRIIAVRYRGSLVGYAGVRIFRNMQSRNVTCAYIQEYYISPAFRKKGMSGIRLFRFIEQQLEIMKVRHVCVENRWIVRKERGGLGRLFDFLGYGSSGELRTKAIGVA